jgi:hypothetical protein
LNYACHKFNDVIYFIAIKDNFLLVMNVSKQIVLIHLIFINSKYEKFVNHFKWLLEHYIYQKILFLKINYVLKSLFNTLNKLEIKNDITYWKFAKFLSSFLFSISFVNNIKKLKNKI